MDEDGVQLNSYKFITISTHNPGEGDAALNSFLQTVIAVSVKKDDAVGFRRRILESESLGESSCNERNI